MKKIIILMIIISSFALIRANDFLSLGEEAYEAGKINEAIFNFKKGASSGDGFCCYRLSCLYFGDPKTTPDIDKALYWAKEGYSLKDPYSTGMLGFILVHNNSNLRDTKGMTDAIQYMSDACNKANEKEIHDPFFASLANMIAGYYIENNDSKKSKEWIKFVTENYSQYEDIIGNVSYMLLGLQDYTNAYKYASLANEREKLYSNFVMGFCLANGVGGVEINPEMAFKHMRTAALIGMPNGKAEYLMGVFYEKGIGCKSDMQKAKEWYNKGAQKGDDQATLRIKQLQ